ncbi:MAG: exodeoxyribonuclease VII large subunit [Oscillospiraceae bacterium]
MAASILKVSQLNKYVKSIFDNDSKLKEIYVKGELSDFKISYNGHAYFSLKDENALVRGVMFSRNVDFLKFLPQNGMSVLVRGYISLYEKDGSYMYYASDMSPYGEGEMSQKQEQIREKLAASGYFDEKNKRALPSFPKTVGIVTSLKGAAIGDIVKTLQSRCPFLNIIVSPAAVQGEYSAKSIVDAIERINLDGRSEVVIIGRGGGSTEDLQVFNQEETVKAVYNSKIPTISAVGHEKDLTLCDLAADVRAATPTAAAQIAVPEAKIMKDDLLYLKEKLVYAFTEFLKKKENSLAGLAENPHLKNAATITEEKEKQLEFLNLKLREGYSRKIQKSHDELSHLLSLIDAVNPMNILKRGYAVILKDNKNISGIKDVNIDDNILIKMFDGTLTATIIQKENNA